MSTIYSTTFTGADNASLGDTWVDQTGDMQRKNNQMFASGGSFSTDGKTVGSADYMIEVDQTYDGTQDNWVQQVARATGATPFDDCYFSYIQNQQFSTDFARLHKRVAGVQTQLGSDYTFTATATTTKTWKLSVIGTAITLYENGVSKIAATDSTHTTEGVHGIRMGNGFYCDNYILSDSHFTGTQTCNESIVLVDTLSKSTTRSLTDVLTLVDGLAAFRALSKTLSESVTLVDGLVRGVGRSLLDALSLSDGTARSLSRTLTDALSLVDTFAGVVAHHLSLLETVTLTDIFNSMSPGHYVQNFIESISLQDGLGTSTRWFRKVVRSWYTRVNR